jgi:phage FluMu protein Com
MNTPKPNTAFSHGHCPRCKQLNLYGKLTCDFCGDRLPWAAATTAQNTGANCPHCHRFNPYCETACEGCGKRLPWADAVEILREARRDAAAEQRRTAVTLTVCIIVALFLMTMMMVDALRPG